MIETGLTAVWMIMESTIGVVEFVVFGILVSIWAILTTK